MISRLPLALLLLVSAGCVADPDGRLNAVAWMHSAAERDALCRQAFTAATTTLDRALLDPNWSACVEQGPVLKAKPPAIICDVDDTLLETAPYQLMAVMADRDEPPSFVDWALLAEAPALPGALDFVKAAEERGITIFYVTNRGPELREATRQNLAAQGFPLSADVEPVQCLRDNPDKGPRRAAIAHDYRVIMMLGDNLSDFDSTFTGLTPDERSTKVDQTAAFWGERWIVLPNPVYGDWKHALLGWEETDPEDEDEAVIEFLAGWPQEP
jgi:5'-nucleotidase (lipoprotein e(P4) family)